MRFATRAFLISFIPLAVLLCGSFWAIQSLVENKVRDSVRSSLRQTHASMTRVRAKSESQNSRFLRVIGENPSLKAGLQLLLFDRRSRAARLTVEDQLREFCENLGFDFLMISDPDNTPLAGVIRDGEGMAALDPGRVRPPRRGFLAIGARSYQIASTPINRGEENLGFISVGEQLDFSEFSTPTVLSRDGQILLSNITTVPAAELQTAFARCKLLAECEVRLGGETFLSLPMETRSLGDGYVLRSLQSIDAAVGPLQAILRNVFLFSTVVALLLVLMLSAASSRSIVHPIAGVVAHLRETERTGLLPEFTEKHESIYEIRELTESFNHAAAAIREARENLHKAYVGFVGSLASALDARDRYTAGHSRRVSDLSCAIAESIHLTPAQVEELRIGALLHDIGKIGIADGLLQKEGKLTPEEYMLVQEHPAIGRRIIEGVPGFKPFVEIVELHHENWDGSGYPHRLRGEATPLLARIVHVADAYDAMTSHRPYRAGMEHQKAVSILRENAGTQFDPAIVLALLKMDANKGLPIPDAGVADDQSLLSLVQTLAQRPASAHTLETAGRLYAAEPEPASERVS